MQEKQLDPLKALCKSWPTVDGKGLRYGGTKLELAKRLLDAGWCPTVGVQAASSELRFDISLFLKTAHGNPFKTQETTQEYTQKPKPQNTRSKHTLFNTYHRVPSIMRRSQFCFVRSFEPTALHHGRRFELGPFL
jgi:hypothetical protein